MLGLYRKATSDDLFDLFFICASFLSTFQCMGIDLNLHQTFYLLLLLSFAKSNAAHEVCASARRLHALVRRRYR